MQDDTRPELEELRRRLAATEDAARVVATEKRHSRQARTARENLEDLLDPGSFIEYGQLTVAAQRSRRDYLELQRETPGDGLLTGIGTIDAAEFGADRASVAVLIGDYSVLAGTQGYYHHKKLDRMCELAAERRLPVIVYTEGGGGRPGDTDILTGVSGLDVMSFAAFGALAGRVPRIAVNHGYCFAGNAVLFGSADVTIATRRSFIGMAGPAMIEYGGLGKVAPTDIGPIEVQERNGVVDVVADDEAHATALARQTLSYFQGRRTRWEAADQASLRDALPKDRRYGYPVRPILETLFDVGSFLELKRLHGGSVITGLARLEGRAVGVLASDCQQMAGAIDSTAAEKAASFLDLCDAFGLPIVSLTDTPGFMVGLESERTGAVRRMSRLLTAGARLRVPIVNFILRKAYGLGAMALAGGSLKRPALTYAWPTGEFGAMGLEGAVMLGYRKELDAVEDPEARKLLFHELLERMFELGRATESAACLEIDGVIDPADSRRTLSQALAAVCRLP